MSDSDLGGKVRASSEMFDQDPMVAVRQSMGKVRAALMSGTDEMMRDCQTAVALLNEREDRDEWQGTIMALKTAIALLQQAQMDVQIARDYSGVAGEYAKRYMDDISRAMFAMSTATGSRWP